jgi:hypothetical protein
VPFSLSTVALKYEKFGFDLYKDTEIGVAFSLAMDKNISGGFGIHFHRIDIDRYGSVQSMVFHAGILSHIFENVSIGFHFENLTGATIGHKHEKIPQVCALGTCWSPLDGLLISIEMEKDIRYPASIKWGIEQVVFDIFALRAGAANNPSKYSAGFSVRYYGFEFGYAGYSHFDLGWTHQIEITIQFDK